MVAETHWLLVEHLVKAELLVVAAGVQRRVVGNQQTASRGEGEHLLSRHPARLRYRIFELRRVWEPYLGDLHYLDLPMST